MDKFDKNIKQLFDDASVDFNASHWDAFETKWDASQMSELLYTQKLSNALTFSMVPYRPGHWSDIAAQLNEIDQRYERKVQEVFENASLGGPAMGWEVMESKLNADAAPFEKALKEKLEAEEVPYNPEHWERFAARGKNKKYLLVGMLSVLMIGGLSLVWMLNSDGNKSADLGKDELQGKRLESTIIRKIEGTSTSKVIDPAVAITQRKEAGVVGDAVARVEHVGGYLPSKGNKSATTFVQALPQKKNVVVKAVNKKQKISNSLDLGLHAVNIASLAINAYVAKPRPLSKLDENFEVYGGKVMKENLLPLGMVPLLNFWDNPALTGLHGKHRIAFLMDQEFKVISQYGKTIGTELSQPFRNILSYERDAGKGWSFGVYAKEDFYPNWRSGELSVTVAYEKNIAGIKFRGGVAADLERSRMTSENLQIIDNQIQGGQNVITTKSVQELEVTNNNYASLNFGVSAVAKHYFVHYGMKNLANRKFNFQSELKKEHQLVAGVTSKWGTFRMASMLKVVYRDSASFSPAVSMSNNNKWFFMWQYEDMRRNNLHIGRQWNSGWRLYGGLGSVFEREQASVLRGVFAQRSHVLLGINYIIE